MYLPHPQMLLKIRCRTCVMATPEKEHCIDWPLGSVSEQIAGSLAPPFLAARNRPHSWGTERCSSALGLPFRFSNTASSQSLHSLSLKALQPKQLLLSSLDACSRPGSNRALTTRLLSSGKPTDPQTAVSSP